MNRISDFRQDTGAILSLVIKQVEPALYEYHLFNGQEELDAYGGFTSLSAAIQDAGDVTGDIKGFEIRYQGLVIGTYPLDALRESAESIALCAVETIASFHKD